MTGGHEQVLARQNRRDERSSGSRIDPAERGTSFKQNSVGEFREQVCQPRRAMLRSEIVP
jgi:hypothetical protein